MNVNDIEKNLSKAFADLDKAVEDTAKLLQKQSEESLKACENPEERAFFADLFKEIKTDKLKPEAVIAKIDKFNEYKNRHKKR